MSTKIFISLVAYKDLELTKTVDRIFDCADNPNDIVVGIVNQDDADFVYTGKYSVKVKNIKPKDSRGYCWCRSLCNETFYNGEAYYMQVAPHSMFKKGFDTYFKDLYAQYPKKTILCGRPLEYFEDGKVSKDYKVYSRPLMWSESLIIHLFKQEFTDEKPFEVSFMMAGCVFTTGDWAKDVPYDPYLYLWGEETDISARSSEKGYKMTNIVEMPVYHLYHRKKRTGFEWDRDKKTHDERTQKSLKRMWVKLGKMTGEEPEMEKYGLKSPKEAVKRFEKTMRGETR